MTTYMYRCLTCTKEHEYKLTRQEAYVNMKLICPNCKTTTMNRLQPLQRKEESDIELPDVDLDEGLDAEED